MYLWNRCIRLACTGGHKAISHATMYHTFAERKAQNNGGGDRLLGPQRLRSICTQHQMTRKTRACLNSQTKRGSNMLSKQACLLPMGWVLPGAWRTLACASNARFFSVRRTVRSCACRHVDGL